MNRATLFNILLRIFVLKMKRIELLKHWTKHFLHFPPNSNLSKTTIVFRNGVARNVTLFCLCLYKYEPPHIDTHYVNSNNSWKRLYDYYRGSDGGPYTCHENAWKQWSWLIWSNGGPYTHPENTWETMELIDLIKWRALYPSQKFLKSNGF